MAAVNLKSMDVDALLVLRADIDKQLTSKRRELEAQLSRLSDSGETSGRGARATAASAVRARLTRSRARRWLRSSAAPAARPGPAAARSRAGCRRC